MKGPQVTTGYRNNDAANSTAFIDGWFRTGDEGYLDGDWLTLTGRLKEMINRGGEKISPLEVEEALLNVPGVRACVAFAVPHRKLGEEVGAAIVTDDVSLELSRVRRHLKQVLGAHKIPREITLVEEIPLGPTGKVQRSQIAGLLGL